MNYHLMIDEKFIDGFIESAEMVAPSKNIYVFDVPTPGRFVSYAGINGRADDAMVAKLLDDIGENDRVYVHWFNEFAYSFVSKLKSNVPVYLFFWGGDFLSLTKELTDFNLDRLSRKYARRQEKRLIAYIPRNPIFYLINVKRYFRNGWERKKMISAQIERRRSFLNRLNFFCHWNNRDLKIVTKAYGGNPEFKDFFYGVQLDKVNFCSSTIKEGHAKEFRIWLGNSDTITNNHLDALKYLCRFKSKPIKIFCPLSYERGEYGQYIQNVGKKYFSDKWYPVAEFMPISDYLILQESMDVVVMFHNRTQAAGNIFAFLKMGKKVYLKRQSTIFSLLVENGITVFDSNTISQVEFEEFTRPLGNQQKLSNSQRISEMFSKERLTRYMETILQ